MDPAAVEFGGCGGGGGEDPGAGLSEGEGGEEGEGVALGLEGGGWGRHRSGWRGGGVCVAVLSQRVRSRRKYS